MIENLFILATRAAFRFASPAGALAVEDLWSLPLTSTKGKANLDDIARGLYTELKDAGEVVSFVANPASASTKRNELQAKFDIVKYIIDVRLAENEAKLNAAKRAEQKQKLLAIIDRKSDEALEGKSIAELRAEVEALG